MKRSSWKYPFAAPWTYRNILARKHVIVTRMRNVLIVKTLVGKKLSLYNGKNYRSHALTKSDIGHKFGEFVCTRRADGLIHAKKKKKKVVKKKK